MKHRAGRKPQPDGQKAAGAGGKRKVLLLASVASMIGQFNMSNIRLLQEMGFEVHAACNFKHGNTCDEKQVRRIRCELQRLHVPYHQWDCPRKPYDPRACYQAYVQLWKLTGRYRFAWMHCHSPAGGALGRLIAHRRGIGVIYTAHGFHFYKGAPLKNWLLYYPPEKLLAYWTDVLVTVNREDYRFALQKLKAGKVCHIPGIGIDTNAVQNDTNAVQNDTNAAQDHARRRFCRRHRIPENAVIVLSVGELSRRKNHSAVISALAGLPREDIYYIICGQGELAGSLRAQAEKLGIKHRVRTAGYQADIMPFYQNADIFVHPSLQEGLPAALMEAMAAGKACVVSDIRGNRELVDGAGGVRFPLDKPQALTEALEKLAEDPARRQACGRYNRQKIRKYDRSIAQRRMKEIYAAFDRACRMQACSKSGRKIK